MSFNIILATAAAAATLVSFINEPYCKSVTLPEAESATSCLVYLNLDEEIYRRGDVSSILITPADEPERQLPFVREEQFSILNREKLTYQSCNILDFKELNNNEAELILENINLQMVDSLQINHRSRDFYKKVSIWGSDDRENWQKIIIDAPWFDHTSKVELSNRKISFPNRSGAKYFKLRISNYQETEAAPSFVTSSGSQGEELTREYRQRGVKIDSVSLGVKKIVPAKMFFPKKFELKKISEKEENKTSQYLFESNRTPIRSLLLQTDGMFSRRMKIYGGNDLSQLNLITDSIFSQLTLAKDSPNTSVKLNEITFAPRNFKYYRLEIVNGDDQPLKNLQIIAQGKNERLVLYNPPPRLHVYYGGVKNPANFDLTQTLPQLNRDDMKVVTAELGAEISNPHYVSVPPGQSLDWTPYVKYVIIGIIIFLLSIIIFSLFKKIDFKNEP